MEGKKIISVLDMGQGYSIIKFDDGTFAFAHIIEPELQAEELEELIGGDKPADKKDSKKEDKKDSKKGKKEEPEESSMDWEDLKGMDYDELAKLCKENGLTTKAKDFDEDEDDEVEDFRKAIAEECGIEVPEADDPDDAKDDSYTYEDLEKMDFDELKDVVEEEDLEIDVDDFEEDDEDKLRKKIAKELEIDVPNKKKK